MRRLICRRVSLRITQAELNSQLGVADGLLGKWESFARLPSSFMMVCWCQSLGVVLVPIGLEDYSYA